VARYRRNPRRERDHGDARINRLDPRVTRLQQRRVLRRANASVPEWRDVRLISILKRFYVEVLSGRSAEIFKVCGIDWRSLEVLASVRPTTGIRKEIKTFDSSGLSKIDEVDVLCPVEITVSRLNLAPICLIPNASNPAAAASSSIRT
jgi:hypothetical protein